MLLSKNQISQMIDLSAVKTENTKEEIKSLVKCALDYNCVAIFVLPSYVPFAKELLNNTEGSVHLGSTVGFPSGAHSQKVKFIEAEELVALGCDEIDMVANIGMLKSGELDYVHKEIQKVREITKGKIFKIIFECNYLNSEEIKILCEICIDAKVDYIKTGTGWTGNSATLEIISLMKSIVKERTAIKAAGGVRDLETLLEMYRRGTTRFGIGLKTGENILKKLYNQKNDNIEISDFIRYSLT